MGVNMTSEQKAFVESIINEQAKQVADKKKRSGFWGGIFGFLVFAGKAFWEYKKMESVHK